MEKRFGPVEVAVMLLLTALAAGAVATQHQARLANENVSARAVDSARALSRLAEAAAREYALGHSVATGIGPLPAQDAESDIAIAHRPVTFSRKIAAALERDYPDSRLRVFSNSALGRSEGGALDSFQRDALAAFAGGAGPPFWRAVHIGGNRVRVRYATPVGLGGDCVSCHGAEFGATGGALVVVREASITLPTTALDAAPDRTLAIALVMLAISTGLYVGVPAIRCKVRERTALGSLKPQPSKAAEALEREAMTDPLSLLMNRRAFDALLQTLARQHEVASKQVGLMLLDVDHFKAVNDTYGRKAGDAVIAHLGMILSDSTRKSDRAARIGGETFAIVSPGAGLSDMIDVAQRIRIAIARTDIPVWDTDIRVTVSVGVAVLGCDETPDDCLRRADVLLHQAKSAGRNRVIAQGGDDILARLGRSAAQSGI